VIWVLLGSKGGDNAQALTLARALNHSFETKNLVLKPEFETAKPRVEGSLHHVDLERSDRLEPPWPDAVLTVGRRLSMIALWIKEQSTGRTKIALIGRPKSKISAFDLVIAPLHYHLPVAANVCRIGLPLLKIEPEKLAAAAETWSPRLADLKRPLTVLLIGGSTGSRRFEPRMAREIFSQALATQGENRGGLYVVTSRRTPSDAVDALEQVLPPGAILYRWTSEDADNPYQGLLAQGDRFIVTGDSISMLVEVARLGKPLAIAPLTETPFSRLIPGKYRDFSLLHDYLYRGGWAVRLGEPFTAPASPPPDDTELAAGRFSSLLPAQD
jgi:mitochondrial fission protein ELM1